MQSKIVILGTGGTIAGTAANAEDATGYTAAQLGVAHAVGGARGSAGDGAAGAQDHDFACHERQSG